MQRRETLMHADADRPSPVNATSKGQSSGGPWDRASDRSCDPAGAMASPQELAASDAASPEAGCEPIGVLPNRNRRRSPSRLGGGPHGWEKCREFAMVRGARHPLAIEGQAPHGWRAGPRVARSVLLELRISPNMHPLIRGVALK
jgi:hypothetical protein